jgi:hypothetical protein
MLLAMRTHIMTPRNGGSHYFGIGGNPFTEHVKTCLNALAVKQIEQGSGQVLARPVVKGQHNGFFALTQSPQALLGKPTRKPWQNIIHTHQQRDYPHRREQDRQQTAHRQLCLVILRLKPVIIVCPCHALAAGHLAYRAHAFKPVY